MEYGKVVDELVVDQCTGLHWSNLLDLPAVSFLLPLRNLLSQSLLQVEIKQWQNTGELL